MASDTRARILATATDLFRQQGFGVGLKQITTQSSTPFGSLYHHFPNGKEEIADHVIRGSENFYRELVLSDFDFGQDLPANIRMMFAGAAQHLETNEFTEACPIATVALEVSSTSERLRLACSQVFGGWLRDAVGLFVAAGYAENDAQILGTQLLCSLEGAFILCRVHRSTQPLLDAGEAVALLAEAIAKQEA